MTEHRVVYADERGWTCACGHSGSMFMTTVHESLGRHILTENDDSPTEGHIAKGKRERAEDKSDRESVAE